MYSSSDHTPRYLTRYAPDADPFDDGSGGPIPILPDYDDGPIPILPGDPGGTYQPTTAPQTDAEASDAGYIRNTWRAYLELWPKILGLQHAAAEIAATTPDRSSDRYKTARAIVDGAAELARIHTATVRQVESYAGYLGLGAAPAAIPGALALAALVAVIAWSFRRYDALDATYAAIESGTVTADEATELLDEAGPMPDVGWLGGISTGVLLGAAAVVGLLFYLGQGKRLAPRAPNPDLMLLGMNPDPEWSSDVLQLDYVHGDNGQPYTHSFKPGVRMQALEDGSVRLYHPRRKIWKEF
jgi:hypothetical protein